MSIDRRQFIKSAAATATLGAAGCVRIGGNMKQPNGNTKQPNIVLIMVDDMGYSDLACFGGTIRTPNLDRLATGGIKYTGFYNSARCCPARASLLTGLYPHQAGMGWMSVLDMGIDGYEGNLNRQCRTLAEVLKPAGYSSYISGKWHVSRGKGDEGQPDSRPLSRGFERQFGRDGGSYFNPKGVWLDQQPYECDPESFYYTDAITDHACLFIDEHRKKVPDKPFFTYVPYTAPHWPLHAKPEDIERYRGRFAKGWDLLRAEKYERMQSLQLLQREWGLSGRDPEVGAWESLAKEQQMEFDLRMAIYAAQLDCMDQGVGRIMETLKQNGIAEDTLVLFLSDNGGCHEEIHWQPPELALFGTDASFESYGRGWANSNAPYREFKSWVHEGGISTPLIAHWPNGITQPGTLNRQPGHITDVMATFCEIAGARYPSGGDDNVPDMVGTSMAPTFTGGRHGRERIFWEHEGNRAIQMDNWKLVAKGVDGPWELYDMHTDRTELNDLAAKDSGRVAAMAGEWHDIASSTNVYPLDGRLWTDRIKAFKKPDA